MSFIQNNSGSDSVKSPLIPNAEKSHGKALNLIVSLIEKIGKGEDQGKYQDLDGMVKKMRSAVNATWTEEEREQLELIHQKVNALQPKPMGCCVIM